MNYINVSHTHIVSCSRLDLASTHPAPCVYCGWSVPQRSGGNPYTQVISPLHNTMPCRRPVHHACCHVVHSSVLMYMFFGLFIYLFIFIHFAHPEYTAYKMTSTSYKLKLFSFCKNSPTHNNIMTIIHNTNKQKYTSTQKNRKTN